MKHLTDEERRRIHLAGQVARGMCYFLYLVGAGVLALLGLGLYIHFTGAEL